MPRKCAFYHCANNNDHDRSMYRFPTNDQNRLKLWLHNAGNRILERLPLPELRNQYLCEDHFDDDFVFKKEGKKNYLKRNAVPRHYNHEDVSKTDSHTPVPSSPTKGEDHFDDDFVFKKQCKRIYLKRNAVPRHLNHEDVSKTDTYTPVPSSPTEGEQPTSAGNVTAQKKRSYQKNTMPPVATSSLGYNEEDEDQLPRPLSPEPSETHLGFTCYACFGPIRGFRYSCVECDNFDLCARCEAMREHDHHYMLRVPGPRPEGEVHAISAELRAALDKQTVQTVRIKEEPGIKCEVEIEEANDVEPGPLYPDPTPVVPVTSRIYPKTEVAQQDGHSVNKTCQELLVTIEQLPDKRRPRKVAPESGHRRASAAKLRPAKRSELAKRRPCPDGGGSPSKIVKTEPDPEGCDVAGGTSDMAGGTSELSPVTLQAQGFTMRNVKEENPDILQYCDI